MMERRAFLALATGGLLAAPRAAEARQPRKLPKLGYLSNSSGQSEPDRAFMDALRALGYVRGGSIEIVDRYSAGHLDRLPDMAADVVARKVDVILAWGVPAAVAAKKLTNVVPIVFIGVVDPANVGLVTSLAHPEGNATGIGFSDADWGPKRLSLLKEAVPTARRIAVVADTTVPGWQDLVSKSEAAAGVLKIHVDLLEVRDPAELGSAFVEMVRRGVNAVCYLISPMLWAHRADLAKLAEKHRLPSIYGVEDYAALGGLMDYGADLREMGRNAATYVDLILKGAKPADLPVQVPSKFYLRINLKTAKALGLTIPQSLLQRADQVIE